MPRSTTPTPHAVTGVAVLAVTALVSGLVALAAPAQAAAAGPTGLDARLVETGTPILSWDPVPGATTYEVQADDDAAFGSPLFTTTTANVAYSWSQVVPPGDQHWRVRSTSPAGPSDWSAAEFVSGRTVAPTLIAPADGAALAQPDEPPLLRWEPVQSARDYVVQVDDETGFASPAEYTTRADSLVVPTSLATGKTYYWRVKTIRATGLESAFSGARSFEVGALAVPTVISPDDDVDNDVTDVVLD